MSKALVWTVGYVAVHTRCGVSQEQVATILFSSTITAADAGAILKVIDILTESDELVPSYGKSATSRAE